VQLRAARLQTTRELRREMHASAAGAVLVARDTDGAIYGAQHEETLPATASSRRPDRRGRPTRSHPRPIEKQQKLTEGTVCPECGAVYRNVRWQWSARAKDTPQRMCLACRRIHHRFPAGVITLHGPLDQSQREDIVRLARHQEEAEKSEHPLNRIVGIENNPGGIVITTTDIHLPRRIGETVKRAFDGVMEIDFNEDGYFVRVNWTPPA
jgi:hypothetical protein